MKFTPPLLKAKLLKRYKRFLADVQFEDGSIVTIHCPNTGSMKNCMVENSDCWLSASDNPKRKYRHTWEIATVLAGQKAGINTGRANALVFEALETGVIKELEGYSSIAKEVRYGEENSRIDFLLSGHSSDKAQKCYLEVKNVTYGEVDGRGLFPDSISVRGQKHLRELRLMVEQGQRAVLLYCVQHSGIDWVEVAKDIDPDYAQGLKEAMAAGVEVYAYRATLSEAEIILKEAIPFKT